MEEVNQTMVTEFILAGLTENPQLQLSLFLIFLGVYLVTVVGNLGMIMLILFSSQLHTPMYYLLSSLSFIDFCQSTVITPKMPVNFVTEKSVISYAECIVQFYFFCTFAVAECHMLAAMAYDRYVAISNPLLYNVTMSYQVCFWMVAGVYGLSLLSATVHTVFLLRLLFCNANIINHYFCDLFPLLELSCSSTFINEVLALSFCVFNVVLPAVTILIVLKSSSLLASSTFSLFHVPSLLGSNKLSSVFYTIVVPMLNPMIYSLRNKDVKIALAKLIQKISFN
uniref:Olfactory receptor n=1 Tax=Cricetulus griseus TaxID=10029 RepID=A0A8C2LS86_CRIGR